MSIEKLIELSRQKLTPEQKIENQRLFEERMAEFDRQAIERYRCKECGADTLNFSHTFKCSRRGLF